MTKALTYDMPVRLPAWGDTVFARVFTVRGFFAGLKKKGFTILAGKNPETKETVYRIPG